MEKLLHIDIETKSGAELDICGVYRYVEDPDFAIQLIGYAYDDEPIIQLDLTNPLVRVPEDFIDALSDKNIVKVIHNSQFERICFSRFLGMPSGTYLSPESWICTMTLGLYRGFPAALENLGVALGLSEDLLKDSRGKRLIKMFGVDMLEPSEHPTEWKEYCEYNLQDVVTERAIYKKLISLGGEYGVRNERLWNEYWRSERINDLGVYLNVDAAKGAVALEKPFKEIAGKQFQETCDELADLRGVSRIDNPNSLTQLRRVLFGEGKFPTYEYDSSAAKEKATAIVDGLAITPSLSKKERTALIRIFTKNYKEALESHFKQAKKTYDEKCSVIPFDKEGKKECEARWRVERDALAQDGEADASVVRELDLKLKICEFRGFLSKASISKYGRMVGCVCEDGRARGLFRFGGAGQTLRYAGRLIQLQNLSKNHYENKEDENGFLGAPEIDELLDRLAKQDITLITERKNFIDDLSQLVRPCLKPKPGYCFAVADFAAIEARVLSWLADEKWRIQAFIDGKDIYCETASKMFGVPVIKHGENGELRAKGKIAELACGYQGGIGAMKAFGADKTMTDEEIVEVVNGWRNSSPNIVAMWNDVQDTMLRAFKTQKDLDVPIKGAPVKIGHQGTDVTIILPNGRELFYNEAAKAEDGKGCIVFKGVGMKKTYVDKETYGGKLVENITQGIARDILQCAITRLQDAGFDIVAHIHDEVIVEIPEDENAKKTLDLICKLMAQTEIWYRDLPLRADGYLCRYYLKD